MSHISVLSIMDEEERQYLIRHRRLEISNNSLLFDNWVSSLLQDFDAAGSSGTFFDVRENLNQLILAIGLFVRLFIPSFTRR